MVTKTCVYCGKEFRIQPSKAEISKCCSKECRDNYKRQGGKRICERCGKEFYYSPSQENTARYCSRECKNNVEARVVLNCQACGKEFTVPPNLKNKKYCSKECIKKPRKIVNKICECCGKEFSVHKCREYEAKYCSLDCAYKHMKTLETDSRHYIKCDNCGREYLLEDYRFKLSKNHFCSIKCSGEFQNKQIEKTCLFCGKKFKVKPSRVSKYSAIYCSMKCRSRDLVYNPADPHFYKTSAWLMIRETCLIRDNYTCQHCGKTDEILQVHHIKPRRRGGTDTLDNLISLCTSCHMKAENKTL